MLLSLRPLLGLGLLLGAPLLILGCGRLEEPDRTEVDEPTADAGQAIKGGYTDDTDKNVVGVVHFQQGAICTGSLIAPNVVLTARHCVGPIQEEASGGGVVCGQTESGTPWSASGFGVTTVTDMFDASISDFFDVAEVVVTPGEDYLCGADQAILILAEPIPESLAKPLIPRVDSKLAENESYYAVGYGQTSDGDYDSSGTRRRRDDLQVYCAEDDCTGVAQYVKVTEWIGDTGICSGDSGGPAMDEQNRVVGVTSRGGADCSSPIYGSVHRWGDWIKETAARAAEQGGYEPAPWVTGQPTDAGFNAPVGGGCEENACGICWDDVCTRYCVEDAGCPDGYACEEVQADTSVCVAIPEPPPNDNGDGDGASADDDGGCTIASPPGETLPADPTNPVPWMVGVGAIALLASRRRRR